MPYTASYLFPIVAPTAATTEVSGFPGDGGVECMPVIRDQAYYMALFDRVLPPHYVASLKASSESGAELLYAFAAMGAAVSQAIADAECGLFSTTAEDGSKATVLVTFTRAAAGAAFTLKAGTLVSTSRGGRQFEVLSDVAFAGGDLAKTASAQAVAVGSEYNVRGQRVGAAGDALPGEVDTIEQMVQDPPYSEPGLVVSQQPDASGGVDAWLDGAGSNRGMPRLPAEDAGPYRARIRSAPDTVSPGAVKRLAARILDPYGIPWQFVEGWDVAYQTCFDAPSPNAGTPSYQPAPPANPRYHDNLWALDDSRAFFGGYLLDDVEARGAFYVVVGRVTLQDAGGAYDDPGVLASDFLRRGTPAFDATPSAVVPHPFVLDGGDAPWSGAVASLYAALQPIKAAGVAALVDVVHTY